MHYLASQGDIDMITLLCESGGNLDATDEVCLSCLVFLLSSCSSSFLIFTSYSFLSSCSLVLIFAFLPILQQKQSGETPLHFAIHAGQAEMLSYLVNAGADINKADEKGETPLLEVARIGNEGWMSILIENGADLTMKTKVCVVPFFFPLSFYAGRVSL
jgi:ankyrin repeat protein